ncbi:AAA family ATPase [Humidesulfovibrio sp.]
MARSDLLLSLVRAGFSGDKKALRATVESIIAEEKSKQHNILADRLLHALRVNGSENNASFHQKEADSRVKDLIHEVVPRKRLAELVLSNVCRKQCQELIEEQSRSDILRAYGLEPRHRLLLVGPPGNGKTSLAEAIAESLSVPFFIVRYEAIIGSYLGETAVRLKRVFDYARTTPCVLFFDEFDAVGKERGDTHETGEIKRVVTSLLMQVDDLPSYAVVIAATNHAELLDRAVWRRFQIRLNLPTPTREELADYFNKFQNEMNSDIGYSSKVLANKLGPISYAEAEQFCLDIRRRHALAMGEKSLKHVVSERLIAWRERVTAATNEEPARARKTSSRTPRSDTD